MKLFRSRRKKVRWEASSLLPEVQQKAQIHSRIASEDNVDLSSQRDQKATRASTKAESMQQKSHESVQDEIIMTRLVTELEATEQQRQKEAELRLQKLPDRSPLDLPRLRNLVQRRYRLDTEIWNMQDPMTKENKSLVYGRMCEADEVLREIHKLIDDWRGHMWWSEELNYEWNLAQRIKHRLYMDGKRNWEHNPLTPVHPGPQESNMTPDTNHDTNLSDTQSSVSKRNLLVPRSGHEDESVIDFLRKSTITSTESNVQAVDHLFLDESAKDRLETSSSPFTLPPMIHARRDPDDYAIGFDTGGRVADQTMSPAPREEQVASLLMPPHVSGSVTQDRSKQLREHIYLAQNMTGILIRLTETARAGKADSHTQVRDCIKKAEDTKAALYTFKDSEDLYRYLDEGVNEMLDRTMQELNNAIMKCHFAALKDKRTSVSNNKDFETSDGSVPLEPVHDAHQIRGDSSNVQRVRWTCVCGVHLFDDYAEVVPGSVIKLQERLREENWSASLSTWPAYWSEFIREAFTSLAPITNTTGYNNPVKHNTSAAPSNTQGSPMPPNNNSNASPHGQQTGAPAHSISSSTNTPQPSSMVSSVLYVLLCLPVGLTGLRLHHAQVLVQQLKNDQQFFQLLRTVCGSATEDVTLDSPRTHRAITLTSRLSLRAITRVSLSHFLVDLSQYVDLKPHSSICAPASPGCRCLPPANMISPAPAAEYVCDPVQPDYMPPFGVNYLTHYFQNPTHLNPNSGWVLRQVPKRMAGQLMACSDAGFAKGWGLAFEEGWDRRRIAQRVFVLAVIGALLSGVLYAVFKKDVQSAFSISGFIVSVLALIGGYLGAGEARGFVHE